MILSVPSTHHRAGGSQGPARQAAIGRGAGKRPRPGAGGHVKPHYYSQHAAALRAELGEAVDRDVLRALHRRSAGRHLVLAARQFAILAACTWALVRWTAPWAVVPLVLVQGFTVFNFTVLLHEVVHHAVFDRRRPRAERWLG